MSGEANDIPVGTYRLELGKSFTNKKAPDSSFNTLRYDFKPSSVSNEAETYIAYGNTGDVHVAVPNEGDNLTVFKGSKKEAKPKECLLFFDSRTKTVRLETISANINVKKTRDLDANTEASLRTGIERLRTTSVSQESAGKQASPRDRKESSSSSSSSSGSDSSSDDSDDDGNNKNASSDSDDENDLLAKMNAPGNNANQFQNMPSFEQSSRPASHSTKNDANSLGLVLSESSDDDD